MRLYQFFIFLCLVIPVISSAEEAAPPPAGELYRNDFSAAETGKPGKEFLILDGKFTIVDVEGNRMLELPGEPLESYGLLFGPSQKEGVQVEGRMLSESTRRTFPAFGIGLNGVSGYRVLVAPAKKSIEIYRGTEVKATAPFTWKSGAWTHLKLEVATTSEGKWLVKAKVWQEGSEEPADWVSFEDAKEPPKGRASIWGTPFSGKKIYYDDLVVRSAVP
ncbi:MAG: hypothetical protein KJ050_02395 [Candidatus Omnitrophica bacterium]|nr:MAG: hypothetical protein UZ16_OP3001000502 [Candidatus Hinthialibacteria bacterium OLB16]MBE7488791.1 hypothetical protein [bacterium]MBW7938279.1 hypothetical protein [Candidatus Omnitrophota bacterium]MCE7909993.1 hypothetical protein [Candidatus Omnitrophica bacterium COP1]MCC6731653.1 hypothetical protein [Candidatus Omnitrophota bacterium]